MDNFWIYLIIAFVVYVASVFWAHNYWSKHMNENNLDLCAEEAHLIMMMLFAWFFFWDGIEVIMKHANKRKPEPHLRLVREE